MGDLGFEKVDYASLTRKQKLAYLLIIVGPELAAQLIKDLEDQDIEDICREIANIQIVERETQEKIIEEFSNVVGDSISSVLAGANYARKALEIAKGDHKAANFLGRIAPVNNSSDVIREIGEMEPRQIFNLVKNEQAQTIAFIVSHFNTDKAAEVISMFSTEIKEDILEKIGIMEQTSLEIVGKVVGSLKKHVSDRVQYTVHKSGGIRTVADLLNFMDKDVSKILLAKLEEKNATLGGAIRKKMFSFEDLGKLNPSDLQRITREIETSDLVMALKSANATLLESILSSVSKRAAESIKEEIELLGPVRLKDVENAQDKIIQIVRNLEESGEISISEQGGDRVID